MKDIKNLIYNNPFYSRYDIANIIEKKYNIKINLNTISLIYKKLNLTWKKPLSNKYKKSKIFYIYLMG